MTQKSKFKTAAAAAAVLDQYIFDLKAIAKLNKIQKTRFLDKFSQDCLYAYIAAAFSFASHLLHVPPDI